MVKRFINKMDFEALEVKMKKCKVSCTIHSKSIIILGDVSLIGTVLSVGRH